MKTAGGEPAVGGGPWKPPREETGSRCCPQESTPAGDAQGHSRESPAALCGHFWLKGLLSAEDVCGDQEPVDIQVGFCCSLASAELISEEEGGSQSGSWSERDALVWKGDFQSPV